MAQDPVLLNYNNKGGVDNSDKLTGKYSKRMTSYWTLAIFYSTIHLSANNAFVIWTEMEPRWNPGKLHWRRIFLEQLGISYSLSS